MPFKPKIFTNQGVGIEQTSVQTITQVKQRRAPSVLGWVTALEHWVLLAFQALSAQPLRPGQACLFLAFSVLSFIYLSFSIFFFDLNMLY